MAAPQRDICFNFISNRVLPHETMAFEAWEGGGVKDWTDLACAVGSSPKHEEVIEEVMNRGTL